MTATATYSEESKLEMEKYFIDLSIKLIKKGYWLMPDKNGMRRRALLTIDDIYSIREELKQNLGDHIFPF